MTTTQNTIRCGNCKESHSTTAAVKACYGNSGKLGQAELPTPFQAAVAAVEAVDPNAPTEKQTAFIAKLAAERPSFVFTAPINRRDASYLIDTMLQLPKEKKTAGASATDLLEVEGVEDGYYALLNTSGTNDLNFIMVATGKESKKRYIKRVLGGQGNIPIPYAQQRFFAKLLSEMTPNARENAMILFGRELGRCGCCGKTLTDEVSRNRGIGPKCWENFG